uniref:Uncharacterized protein n=1 Tax=Lepeophtheirus salmonis TaxID=72036 RepID=A0A0K2URK2_LEPSM
MLQLLLSELILTSSYDSNNPPDSEQNCFHLEGSEVRKKPFLWVDEYLDLTH